MTPDLIDAWTEDETPAEPTARPLRRNTGAATLDQTRAFLARFATFPSQAALDAATLFCVHTHVVDNEGRLGFSTTPGLPSSQTCPRRVRRPAWSGYST